MESVNDFALYDYGNGFGSGDGSSGYGVGYGSGGDSDCGDGSDYGRGNVSGYGIRYGCGFGGGGGSDYCNGYGRVDFSRIKSYNGKRVYDIDGVATLIFSVHGNLAKCKTIGEDLTLSDCYVAKNGSFFAHGDTAREAIFALRVKVITNMNVDEKISEFLSTFERGKKYLTIDFYRWHNLLTGSCEYGRQKFAKEHGVDIAGEMTVDEFIALTEDAYGGNVIKKLKDRYAE